MEKAFNRGSALKNLWTLTLMDLPLPDIRDREKWTMYTLEEQVKYPRNGLIQSSAWSMARYQTGVSLSQSQISARLNREVERARAREIRM
jgi:hypothetical protein